jgi:hypothetical protein
MTVIRRWLGSESGRDLQLAGTYIENNSEVRMDYENFIQGLVQAAYLIYSCKYYGFNPVIDLQGVRVLESNYNGYETRFGFVIYYRFVESERDSNSYSLIVRDIYKYLLELNNVYEKKVKAEPFDNEYRVTVSNFTQQLAMIEAALSGGDSLQQ